MINLIHSERVTPTETHFRIDVNGKVIEFAKWVEHDWTTDYEYIKGEDLLDEDEEEEVSDFIDEQVI